MKLRSKIRRELVLLSIPVVLLPVVVLYLQNLKPTSGRLIGTWRIINASDITSTTFKVKSEFEMVIKFSTTGRLDNADGTSIKIPLVFKGRYSDTKKTIRFYDIQRYRRISGKDILFVPGNCGINCVVDNEIFQADKEWSQHHSTITFANWKAGIMKVRSPIFWQSGGTVSTWTRQ